MLIIPNKDTQKHLDEVTAFAKEHDIYDRMPKIPEDYSDMPYEKQAIIADQRRLNMNNLQTKLDILDAYGEQWEEQTTLTTTHDGQSQETIVVSEETTHQICFTRCWLFIDRGTMSFEWTVESWDRDAPRPPHKGEYKIGTYLEPEDVCKQIDEFREAQSDCSRIAPTYYIPHEDYIKKYGCRWEELPWNKCMNCWKRMTNGGLIYDGPEAPCDGSGPQFTVSLVKRERPGWGIHT